LEERNNQLREETDLYAKEQVKVSISTTKLICFNLLSQREELEAKETKEREFRALAENLHHLMSTKQIRGVFNPRAEYVNVRFLVILSIYILR
jgi:hypothetical protein